MTYSRTITPICTLLATAVLALGQSPAPRAAVAPSPPEAWQDVPPAPPAPPAPAPAAVPAPAPMPAMPAMPPMPPMPPMPAMDFQYIDRFDSIEIQEQIERAKEMAHEYAMDAQELKARTLAAAADMAGWKMAFAPQVTPRPATVPIPPTPPAAMGFPGRRLTNMSDDRAYQAGQSALDSAHYDQAAEYFGQVASRNGNRADGALYWKAYALGKLGKRDEALAAIAELRKSYASSRWMDDAKALELELRQASGQAVSPDSQSDDELKLMAINGLMQSDPEKALPLLEKQLKGSASPRVKRNALFVLAQSSSPKAQQMLEQIARGGANPDLQAKAIVYMTERRRNVTANNNAQVLADIYAATTDPQVKRAVLQAFVNLRDKEHLLAAARNEKNQELREVAISYLGDTQGNPELWQLYASETTPEGKIQLLRYMHGNSNPDKLLEVAKTEKDQKVRLAAVRALASQRSGNVADSMAALYNAEQDPQIKSAILDSLMSQRNAKALVDIARNEKDMKMKLRIVERLSNMKGSKEAQDYLQEILSK